ncbi:MAG: 4Fe-4S ferredoxin [Gemmataceae bacterium]|nr:4Fe-4S ferredoxin [Gemmataceae bacterium]
MPVQDEFFIDPNRCIGCQACVHACSECETHKGHSMIHLDYLDRGHSIQTVPTVCMHCLSPVCADVCPADAIKRMPDGRVMTARKPRCIACSNCVLACPFGVPTVRSELELMMKCDMCFDRTSAGRKPMCAPVCPSGALFYGPRAQVEQLRPRSKAVREFHFGKQKVTTLVSVMVPASHPSQCIDLTASLHDQPNCGLLSLTLLEPDFLENAHES